MAPSSSGKAPDCKSGFTGSIPVGAFKYSRSSAEEQLGDIEKVGGSIPLVSTNKCPVSLMDKAAAYEAVSYVGSSPMRGTQRRFSNL